MKVVGVMHRLRNPSPFREPILQLLGKSTVNIGKKNAELEFVEKHIKSFLATRPGEELRVGVEGQCKENELDPHNPSHVFVSAVYGLQKRYPGLRVFPLERDRFSQLVSDLELYIGAGSEEAPLAVELVSKAKELGNYNKKELILALSAYRSLLMRENAEREKAHIIVIGGAHAGHLENLENSNDVKKIAAEKHEFFYSPVTLKLPEIRKPVEDLNALRKYHDVITSVVKEFIYCNAAWR